MNRFTRSQIQRLIVILLALGVLVAGFGGSSPSAFSAPTAVVRYVLTTGEDLNNNCVNAALPCRTIQHAVNVALPGDVINIGSGIYFENVVVDGKNLTLQGQGAATTFVNGNKSGSVLIISGGSVIVSKLTLRNGSSSLGGGISIDSGVAVTVSDSNIVDNTANQGGAGIWNQGNLNLVNVLLRNNLGSAGGNTTGGGIYNAGEANLNGVSILGNAATIGGGIGNINLITLTNSFVGGISPNDQNQSTGGGGGIYNFGVSNNSTVVLINSSVVGNQAAASKGGGIYNANILIASNAVITGNVATLDGGGIYSEPNGQVTLNGGSIVSNTSIASNGGGIYNAGAVVIDNVLFNINKAGSGGGMFNAAGGKLSVNDTTVSNNTASGSPGGGINSQGTLTLTKSAVIYNAANSSQGGGLNIAGKAWLNNVTISDNTATDGSGLFNEGSDLKISFSTISFNNGAPAAIRNTGSSAVISSSILAQNSGTVCQGTFTTGGYNIDRGTSCGLNSPSDSQNTDPKLKPLQNNGGASPTRAIDFSSKAVDSIPLNVCSLNVDQRGVARPQSTGCDSGAYEVVGYSNTDGRALVVPGCITNTISISENLAIGQVLVGVNVAATNRNTLKVTFISPSNRQVTLLNTGGSGANLDTLFDDTAPTFLPGGDQDPASPFYDNIYRPYAPLSQMNGLPIRGNWKLQVCSTGTSGTFNRWAIIVPELTNFKVRLPLVRK